MYDLIRKFQTKTDSILSQLGLDINRVKRFQEIDRNFLNVKCFLKNLRLILSIIRVLTGLVECSS